MGIALCARAPVSVGKSPSRGAPFCAGDLLHAAIAATVPAMSSRRVIMGKALHRAFLFCLMLACGGASTGSNATAPIKPAEAGTWTDLEGKHPALVVIQELRAVVVNYGRLVTSDEKIGAVHAAFLGNFAGADRGIAPADVKTFESKLKEKNKDVDIKIYDGAQHAFMNPENKTGYDEASSKDAWTRIDAFFARTLK